MDELLSFGRKGDTRVPLHALSTLPFKVPNEIIDVLDLQAHIAPLLKSWVAGMGFIM